MKQKELIQEVCGDLGIIHWMSNNQKAHLERLPLERLEARVNILLVEVEGLKSKVKQKDGDAQTAMKKVNESIEVIRKIQEYIAKLGDTVNKACLLDNHFVNQPILGAGIVTILVDYASKMESILENMRALFVGLEPKPTAIFQPTSLDIVPNSFMEMEAIPSFDM